MAVQLDDAARVVMGLVQYHSRPFTTTKQLWFPARSSCNTCLVTMMHLRLLLGGGSLGLGGLLSVAADHDQAQERANHGAAQEDEDDGDADGPLARGEDVLERVVVVDKGLDSDRSVACFIIQLLH
jgi:hypothetical protein